jgi:acyl carrier protein
VISEASENDGHLCEREEALAASPAAAAERGARLMASLRRLAARALGVEAATLPPDRSLTALGLDSLAAAELAGGLAGAVGVAIPFSDLLAGPTLAALCAQVAELLAGGAGSALPKPPTGATPRAFSQISTSWRSTSSRGASGTPRWRESAFASSRARSRPCSASTGLTARPGQRAGLPAGQPAPRNL